MRVGIVGTGFMGQTHAAGWAETPATLAGFVSKDEKTAVSLQTQYGGHIYPDLASMLPHVDVVDVCTPTFLHHKMVLQAAAAGKHVVCEKPLARTLAQAQEMMAACEAAGVKLLIAHVVRFFPEYALAKQKVDDGAVGKTAVIRLKRGTFQPKKAIDNWFLDSEKSGGMMLDLMSHDFDYARWVGGDVVQVYAKTVGNSQPDAAIDHGLAILTHKNGTISHVEGSWAYPPPLFRTQLEIAGDNGLIQFDSGQMAAISTHLHERGADAPDVPLPSSPLNESPYTTQIKEFYDCLENDKDVRITAVDGYKALQIALAAIESAQTGQPVAIEGRGDGGQRSVFSEPHPLPRPPAPLPPRSASQIKIGMMSFAHLHAEAYIGNLRAIPDVDMIGIADDNGERGQKYAAQFDAHLFPSYEALLAEKPDGVLICSENANHRPLVEMAAAAGVHVLCEKPLATTREDAHAMITACRDAGVLLMTAFPMRFSAPLQQLKAQLDAGDLGEIYCLNTTNQGQMPIAHREWFVDKELAGGGAMMDHIVHLADIFNWLFGRELASVYAQSNHIMHADTVEVETGGLIMLQYADGLFMTIDSSWSKPLNYPTWGGLTMEIVSERGLTVLDAFSQHLNMHQQSPSGNQWAYWGSDMNQAMIAEFVNAIREGRETAVTGEDGLFALEVVLAAYESANINNPVKL